MQKTINKWSLKRKSVINYALNGFIFIKNLKIRLKNIKKKEKGV